MSLTVNIYRLTEPHKLIRPDGTLAKNRDGKDIYQPALLDQLANATKSSRGGGQDHNDMPIPINTRAIDLWKQLDTEVRQVTLDRYGHARGHLGALLTRWKSEGDTAWIAHLEHITMDIIDRIETMFDPPPKRRTLKQPCPACGELWTLNSDGDRVHCLTAGTHNDDGTLRNPADCEATCAACEAAWHGEDLAWLLNAIDAPARETTPV